MILKQINYEAYHDELLTIMYLSNCLCYYKLHSMIMKYFLIIVVYLQARDEISLC